VILCRDNFELFQKFEDIPALAIYADAPMRRKVDRVILGPVKRIDELVAAFHYWNSRHRAPANLL